MNNIVQEDIEQLTKTFKFCEQLRGKVVLVTGATGLIGSLIVRLLENLNNKKSLSIKIIAMARNKEKFNELNFTKNVRGVFQDLKEQINISDSVDYIIHTACPTASSYMVNNAVELIEDTVIGTNNLLKFAKQVNCKGFVYLSSIEVYGVNNSNKMICEDDYKYINHLKPRSSYPESKKLLECLCCSYAKEYNLPVMIARLTQTFGAGVSLDDNRVFMQFAKSVCKNEDIILKTTGQSSKSYIYTLDAINAIFYILFNGEYGNVYNVANENNYISIKNMAKFLINRYNKSIKLKIEKSENNCYSDTTKIQLSTKKLENLGWKPQYNLPEMFDRLIDYYRLEKKSK